MNLRRHPASLKSITIIFLFVLLMWQYLYNFRTNVETANQQLKALQAKINYIDCEVIHVGFICFGYHYVYNYYTMLKSLYFYRTNFLHFHIICDKQCKNVLETLFNSWNIPQVKVTFYSNNNFEDTDFTANAYNLLFLEIVPVTVTTKVIILGPDIIFTSNINELWRKFDDFNKHQIVGLPRQLNSSDSLDQNGVGLMLLNTERWNKFGYNKMTLSDCLKHKKNTRHSEDLLNATLTPNRFYYLSCQWYVEQSDGRNDCSYKNFKILHGSDSNSDQLTSYKNAFLDYNGNLLRHQNIQCGNKSYTKSSDEKEFADECNNRLEAQAVQWRTLIYFADFNYTSVDQNDVTIVSQLTYNRWSIFEELVKRWEGPISVAVYATDKESSIIMSKKIKNRTNIAYHMVFKEGSHYPYNKLRNVALRNVVTPYVFLLDIDFLPNPKLYETLRNYTRLFKEVEKSALVVPAILGYKKKFPNDKTELLQMLDKKLLSTGHVGQGPTAYKRWRTAQFPYKVKWKPKFEPYIVVRSNVILYDERFIGYGGDKISHIMELEAQGYQFIVLPDVYIIHRTHPLTKEYWEFQKSKIYLKCLNDLKRRFQEELLIKYGRKLSFGINAA